jgi:hypothetical protein
MPWGIGKEILVHRGDSHELHQNALGNGEEFLVHPEDSHELHLNALGNREEFWFIVGIHMSCTRMPWGTGKSMKIRSACTIQECREFPQHEPAP